MDWAMLVLQFFVSQSGNFSDAQGRGLPALCLVYHCIIVCCRPPAWCSNGTGRLGTYPATISMLMCIEDGVSSRASPRPCLSCHFQRRRRPEHAFFQVWLRSVLRPARREHQLQPLPGLEAQSFIKRYSRHDCLQDDGLVRHCRHAFQLPQQG